MSDRPPVPSRAEREARRLLLQEALAKLAEPGDPDRSSEEVMRALDAYLDVHPRELVHAPREPPVADFDRREANQLRMATWFVLGGALVVTIILAVLLSGGWPAGVAIIAVWLVALFAMLST